MSSFESALAIVVLSALATHYWFKKHEPSSFFQVILTVFALATPGLWLLLPHVSSPFIAALYAYAIFIIALLFSIVAYRISPFHPLAEYPGPLICKLSKIWTAWIARDGKLYVYRRSLHEKYGPIVRFGPNDLSIIEKDLIPLIMGGQGMPKGPLWEGRRYRQLKNGKNFDSLIDCRDLEVHAQLRKPWNKAFSTAPLKDYEELLIPRANQLSRQLEELCKTESNRSAQVDLAKLISFFSFDFMGDIAFGGCFELMRDGDKHGFWRNMQSSLAFSGTVQHTPWYPSFIRSIPFLAQTKQKFAEFGIAQGKKRAAMEMKRKDLFYHLIDAAGVDTSTLESLSLIVSNAMLAIVAGSDTTASALSNLVFYLISNKSVYTRLQQEIDKEFPNQGIIPEKLAGLVYLNAVINETLRLQPPVPTSLQRAPTLGSGGKILGNMFIPEGTAVEVPPYAIHRDPRYFSPNPDKFWPERWILPDTEVTLDRAAFIPFSYGPANCAGRPLAMSEMRFVTALLLKHFEMSFSDGYDPEQWDKNLRDYLVLAKGELQVNLVLREELNPHV